MSETALPPDTLKRVKSSIFSTARRRATQVAVGAALVLAATGCSPMIETNASIPLGVLGDSDSHSYHDRIWLPPGPGEPGGPFRATTFQWTEVIAQLRGNVIDPGDWGVWGERKSWVRLKDWLGLPGRAPRKEDYAYNFALGGSRCEALTTGVYRQAPRLVQAMDRDAQRWRRGVVVIRIGIVDIGLADSLDVVARDADDAGVRARTQACLAHVRAAVEMIQARHTETRVVLVGILDNTDYPPYFTRYTTPTAFANIRTALDRYDDGLKQLVAEDPTHRAFFDDRQWFRQRFGSRHDGYRTVRIGPTACIEHAVGDDPRHSVLADGHAGTAWNAMWVQSLIELLDRRFAMRIPAITDAELGRYVERMLPSGPSPVCRSSACSSGSPGCVE